ncbi:hypothetical protein [Streptosporangium vulgare]|uniref:Uncharacterized protein n=1 Tax=Streptosporangium vulgare TaxID=46190 RepID=A0ABV5TDX2_9ACTN
MSNELADQQQLVLKVATRRRPALIAGQVVSAGQSVAVKPIETSGYLWRLY